MQRHEPVPVAMQQHGGRAKPVDVVDDREPLRASALPRSPAAPPREPADASVARVS